jgi:hypothetical protein
MPFYLLCQLLSVVRPPSPKLSCLGLYASKLSMIKIYVKADTFESRSVTPGQLQRLVRQLRKLKF